MRNIDSTILRELEKVEMQPFKTLELYIDSTYYRYTDCDVPVNLGTYLEIVWEPGIEWGGHVEWSRVVGTPEIYYPRWFEVEAVKYSMVDIVDQMQVEIDNLDYEMTPAFVGSTPRGDAMEYRQVLLSDTGFVIAGSILVFQGEIDSYTLDEETIKMTATSQFHAWGQRTLARHSSSCRWKEFKGTECGYAGDVSWCDRTYGRCQEVGNSANFGGFRFLPDLISAEIWWGRRRPTVANDQR